MGPCMYARGLMKFWRSWCALTSLHPPPPPPSLQDTPGYGDDLNIERSIANLVREQ